MCKHLTILVILDAASLVLLLLHVKVCSYKLLTKRIGLHRLMLAKCLVLLVVSHLNIIWVSSRIHGRLRFIVMVKDTLRLLLNLLVHSWL